MEIFDKMEQTEREELEDKIHEIVKTGHNYASLQVPWSGLHQQTVQQIMDVIDEEIQKQTPLE